MKDFRQVRRVEHEDHIYFSAVDLVMLLSGRDFNSAQKTWGKLKEHNNRFQLTPNGGRLKLPAMDGKSRITDLVRDDLLLPFLNSLPYEYNGLHSAAHVMNKLLKNGRHKPKLSRAATSEGHESDQCQTPPYAIDPLLPYLDPDSIIWEPACGEGMLVEAFYDSGFSEVIASDALTGQNFFDYEPEGWDCLITNPPYSIKYEWLERCYELQKPFALLVPVDTLGAKTAQLLFAEYGSETMFLHPRIDFKMPKKEWDSSAQFSVVWLCWNILPEQVMYGDVTKGKEKFKREHR